MSQLHLKMPKKPGVSVQAQLDALASRLQAVEEQSACERKFTRETVCAQMLNTFLNIAGPKQKKRRNLQDSAHLYAGMLANHRSRGDALDCKEVLFLDVFSKIDELCACSIGNLATLSRK